ncbi:MAG: hypothetical protein J6V34_02145 [Oscillospiraceae bacterium]|nr:hypothetical protein [Oscillospiraceae bacterium]
MQKCRIVTYLLAALIVLSFVGCGNNTATTKPSDVPTESPTIEIPEDDLVLVEDHYDFMTQSKVYTRPAMKTEDRRLESLTLSMDDGFFFCLTTDAEIATEFVNTQRTLLRYLKDHGVEIRKLSYYAVDYDDSFSDSEGNRAYIALSHIKSYRQVLATLHALWGDYSDYGYVFHVANAVAEQLGWQTAPVDEVDQATLDTFFAQNPVALNLVYPCFTTTYADEATVRNCYALSRQIFEKIDMEQALAQSIDEQLGVFRGLVDAYAQEISAVFSRQQNGFAYYGELLPLKIMTRYALLVIDYDYKDFYSADWEAAGDYTLDYFSDYQSIIETATLLDEEVSSAVALFNLEEEAGIVIINWMNAESAVSKSGKAQFNGMYYNATPPTAYITQINAYLHEYAHHLQHLLSPTLKECWQSQAFCELIRARDYYSQYAIKRACSTIERYIEMFEYFAGHAYQQGMDDYFELYDIFTYIYDDYSLAYLTGRNPINSFTHYILDLYGEETTYEVMLFPETVEDITGKTWDVLEAEWVQYIKDKFAGKEIPEWTAEFS